MMNRIFISLFILISLIICNVNACGRPCGQDSDCDGGCCSICCPSIGQCIQPNICGGCPIPTEEPTPQPTSRPTSGPILLPTRNPLFQPCNEMVADPDAKECVTSNDCIVGKLCYDRSLPNGEFHEVFGVDICDPNCKCYCLENKCAEFPDGFVLNGNGECKCPLQPGDDCEKNEDCCDHFCVEINGRKQCFLE